jgi:hypothetical protein
VVLFAFGVSGAKGQACQTPFVRPFQAPGGAAGAAATGSGSGSSIGRRRAPKNNSLLRVGRPKIRVDRL